MIISLDIAKTTGVAIFDNHSLILQNVTTTDRLPEDNIKLWNYLLPFISQSQLVIIENLFAFNARNISNLIIQAERNGYIKGKITEQYNLQLVHVNSVRAFHKIKDKRIVRKTKLESPKQCVQRLICEQLDIKLSDDICDAVAQGLYQLERPIEDLNEWNIHYKKDILL